MLETPGLAGAEAGAAANLRQVEITGASVDYQGAGERPYAITGEPLTVHVDYLVRSAVDAAEFEIEIFSDASGRIYLNRTGAEDSMTLAPGAGSVSFRFDAMPLLDGRYTVNFSLRNAGGVVLAIAEPACAFEVMNPGRSLGVVDLPMRVELTAPGEMRSRPAIRALYDTDALSEQIVAESRRDVDSLDAEGRWSAEDDNVLEKRFAARRTTCCGHHGSLNARSGSAKLHGAQSRCPLRPKLRRALARIERVYEAIRDRREQK